MEGTTNSDDSQRKQQRRRPTIWRSISPDDVVDDVVDDGYTTSEQPLCCKRRHSQDFCSLPDHLLRSSHGLEAPNTIRHTPVVTMTTTTTATTTTAAAAAAAARMNIQYYWVKRISSHHHSDRHGDTVATNNIRSFSLLLLLLLLMTWFVEWGPTTNTYMIEAYCCNHPKQQQQQQSLQPTRTVQSTTDTSTSRRTGGITTSSTIRYAWHQNSRMPEDSSHHAFSTFHHDPSMVSTTSSRYIFRQYSSHRRWTTCCTALYMGKGDGKKKRTKKISDGNSAGENSNAGTASSSSQPLRVSSNINVPVRQQIAIAQMNKIIRQQQQSIVSSSSSSSSGGGGGGGSASTSSTSSQSFIPVSKPRVRTAYRRTWEEEEIVQKAEERKRRGQEPNWDVILNRTAVSPLLIVDGYNIIHAWPRLKKHMTKGDPSRARQLLMDDLENLQSIKGWRIECVFDGTRRSTIGPLGSGPGSSNGVTGMVNPVTRGSDQATKQSVSKYGVRVVYSGVGIEADSYIEGRCLRAKNVTHGAITGSLIVATDDAMIRLSGQNAGAVCMSSSRFVDELKAVQKAVAYRVEAAVAKVNGHAIRPEQLRGTVNHVAMPTRFGRRSVLIEDKRNRTKTNKKDDMIDEEYESYLSSAIQQQAEEDENGIPWWAKVPEQAKADLYKRT